MQRTTWRGFGDGDAGSADATTVQDLVNIQNARLGALTDVDPFTALQSKISAAVPSGVRLPLILASVGLLALILTPSGGRGRR